MTVALLSLIALGACLRLAAMFAASRGFLGYNDSALYIDLAQHDLFRDAWRPAGYPVFLQFVHLLNPSLSFTILVQHVLGIATAVLLYLAVGRVAPRAWGLLPAAVILLSGPQLFLEHSPLAEAFFTFLLAVAAYAAIRALESGPFPWAMVAGLAGAAAACVRVIGLLLPVAVAIALAFGLRGHRLRAVAATLLPALLLIAIYVSAMRHETHYTGVGLTRASGWAIYTRMAPFADCDRFTPPAGTRKLCERRPAAKRPDPSYYSLTVAAPALRLYGNPFRSMPRGDSSLSAFARAAVIHQPVDYLRDVSTDLSRFWSSDRHYATFAGQSYDALAATLLQANPQVDFVVRRGWYHTDVAYYRAELLDAVRSWERHTRLEGPLFVVLLLLTATGIPFARGQRLAAGLLMLGLTLITLVSPVMTAFFDARYAAAGYGPLAAAAALGAAALRDRLAWREGRLRLQAPTPAPVAAAPAVARPATTRAPPRRARRRRRR